MNPKKTGAFIKELRSEHNLTQEQLGEKLLVTNKTVSRWETGDYLPPIDVLEAMSTLFGVSINELLSGCRLKEEEYVKFAEENLKQTISASSFSYRERLEFFKCKWRKEHVQTIATIIILLLAELIIGIVKKSPVLIGLFPLLAVLGHMRVYNGMMAFAEDLAVENSKAERETEA